jgi:hypothetical protein
MTSVTISARIRRRENAINQDKDMPKNTLLTMSVPDAHPSVLAKQRVEILSIAIATSDCTMTCPVGD